VTLPEILFEYDFLVDFDKLGGLPVGSAPRRFGNLVP
jgi:hypothetical protein